MEFIFKMFVMTALLALGITTNADYTGSGLNKAHGLDRSGYRGQLAGVYNAPTYGLYGENANNGYGASHHRQETGQGGVVRGSYGYIDAQGLRRTVNYIADAGGFRAQINSNEPGVGPESPADVALYSSTPPFGVQERYTNRGYGQYGGASHGGAHGQYGAGSLGHGLRGQYAAGGLGYGLHGQYGAGGLGHGGHGQYGAGGLANGAHGQYGAGSLGHGSRGQYGAGGLDHGPYGLNALNSGYGYTDAHAAVVGTSNAAAAKSYNGNKHDGLNKLGSGYLGDSKYVAALGNLKDTAALAGAEHTAGYGVAARW